MTPLSIALESFEPSPAPAGRGTEDPSARLRRLLAAARGAGFRAATLSATALGLRPRELDRSARREVAALFRREELAFTGIEAWIPAGHFADEAHADRAVTAVVQACELADELSRLARPLGATAPASGNAARPVVCVALPAVAGTGVLGALGSAAQKSGSVLCNFAWPPEEAAGAGADDVLRLGLDCAAAILAGADAALAAATWGHRLGAALLCDASRRQGARTGVGSAEGELDVAAFRASLSVASPGTPVILDPRGTRSPLAESVNGLRVWNEAGEPAV